MAKTVAVIPARYSSKRFKGKPLALIAGKPMIQHVYQRSQICKDIDDIYVATDDARIYECVNTFGGKALLTKKTHPSGTDRIAEAIGKLDLKDQDIVVNIQGDQPIFHPSIISELVRNLKKHAEIPMCSLMHKISDERELNNVNDVKVVVDKRGFALYFSRSPIPFVREKISGQTHYKHLGFYAYRRYFLSEFTKLSPGPLEKAEKLEQLRALEYGFKIKMVKTSYDSIEVDTPEDIKTVEEGLSQ